jgi:hypothetical protein
VLAANNDTLFGVIFRRQSDFSAEVFVAAELLVFLLHFLFSANFDFLRRARTGTLRKKRNPAQVLNWLRIGRIPFDHAYAGYVSSDPCLSL